MVQNKKESCHIQVYVRVRPFNAREISLKQTATSVAVLNRSAAGVVIKMSKENEASDSSTSFVCDEFFCSIDEKSSDFSKQIDVYNRVGSPCVEHIMEGFSACIFAYGQTGSGKTYTMTGTPDDEGLIPRITKGLIDRVTSNESTDDLKNSFELKTSFRLIVRYFEIYNEKAYDLLAPNSPSLRVREHPVTGPFVEGAKEVVINSWQEMNLLLKTGSENRHTAITLMNDKSSRSHSVFQVHLTQSTKISSNHGPGKVVKRESKLNLVDLAGSESSKKSGATGETAVEGQNINLSLLTLGKLIDALLQKQSQNSSKPVHIPYRDSTLTFFLKESIGGNSRTVMLAMVSPALDNWLETKNTLTYAARARKLVNVVHVVEDEAKQVIDELKLENERLKKLLESRSGDIATEQQVQRNLALIDDLHAREEKAKMEWELREKELLIQGEKDAAVKLQLERDRELMKQKAQENERDLIRRNEMIMQLEEKMKEYEDRLISERSMKEELQAALTAKESKFSGEAQEMKSALSMKSLEAKHLSFSVQKKDEEILGTLQNCYDRIDLLEKKLEESNSQLIVAQITIDDLKAVHEAEKKALLTEIEFLKSRPVALASSKGSINSADWCCTQCTYKNKPDSEACEICSTDRPRNVAGSK